MEVGNDELVMVAPSLDAFLIVEWTLDRFARSVNHAGGRYRDSASIRAVAAVVAT